MTPDQRQMTWWGWGEPTEPVGLSAEGERVIRSELGLADGARSEPPALEDVRIGEPALPSRALEGLQAALGDEHVQLDRLSRVRRAAGRNYPDLLRLRSGEASGESSSTKMISRLG